jgi:hypothetical protein
VLQLCFVKHLVGLFRVAPWFLLVAAIMCGEGVPCSRLSRHQRPWSAPPTGRPKEGIPKRPYDKTLGPRTDSRRSGKPLSERGVPRRRSKRRLVGVTTCSVCGGQEFQDDNVLMARPDRAMGRPPARLNTSIANRAGAATAVASTCGRSRSETPRRVYCTPDPGGVRAH